MIFFLLFFPIISSSKTLPSLSTKLPNKTLVIYFLCHYKIKSLNFIDNFSFLISKSATRQVYICYKTNKYIYSSQMQRKSKTRKGKPCLKPKSETRYILFFTILVKTLFARCLYQSSYPNWNGRFDFYFSFFFLIILVCRNIGIFICLWWSIFQISIPFL